MLPVFPLVCSAYERWPVSVEIVQLDDDYLTGPGAGFLGDGKSLPHSPGMHSCMVLIDSRPDTCVGALFFSLLCSLSPVIALSNRPRPLSRPLVPCPLSRPLVYLVLPSIPYLSSPLVGAFEVVKQTIDITRVNPKLLGGESLSFFPPLLSYLPLCLGLTLFMLECQSLSAQQDFLKYPTSPTLSDASTLFSQITIASDATFAPSHLVSEYERTHYYHGISMDPPELLYRSDLDSNPFPVPAPGTRFFEIPPKTAEGVFGTQLNTVWHIVAPMIIALFKKRGIKYSELKTARFSTLDEDGNKKLGPIVVWIATHPNTTTAENARDASPDILRILDQHKVEGAVIEWYEGTVEKLTGPALMRVADETNPTHHVRRPFTAVLGMPVATKEREAVDAQGSVSFFFHENKTKKGETSARVLGVSNKHVLRADTTVDY